MYSFLYLYKCRILSIPSARKTSNDNHNFPERRASASSSSCKNEILQGNCCISKMPLWMDGYLKLCVDSTRTLFWCLFRERNWVFATNSDFLRPISLKPNVVDHRYFKLWILVDQAMQCSRKMICWSFLRLREILPPPFFHPLYSPNGFICVYMYK